MKKLNLPISNLKKIAGETFEIQFDLKEKFDYQAGQYVTLIINEEVKDNRGKSRAFSLSSSPNNKKFISTIFRFKKDHSGFKDYLVNAPIGTKVTVYGPHGNFLLPKSSIKPVVMVAGGIGIVPFISMIKYATETNSNQEIKLLYTDKSEERISYFDELVKLDKENYNFSFVNQFKKIDSTFIRNNSDIKNSLFYICGTIEMVSNVKDMLIKMGIKEKNILLEKFSGYPF
tara:strand:+ start:29635 stop:30324 length:690 start_codon:yes stop_codon:yes gene_type:complete